MKREENEKRELNEEELDQVSGGKNGYKDIAAHIQRAGKDEGGGNASILK